MTATALRKFTSIALLGFSGCQMLPASTPGTVTLDRQVLDAMIEPTRPTYLPEIGRLIAPGVYIPEPDLWGDIRAGFKLNTSLDQARVQQELRWLKDHPSYLQQLAPRLERHLAFVHEQVKVRGIPSEIALLPIVESAFDPYAFSHGGAAGLWQFIPATGKRYGLARNWWYDGRRDPVTSTAAALNYLTDLHLRFGDWYLALAGYNAGEGNVQRAVRRAEGSATFWELSLPRETSAYVPRLLALAEIVTHPARYGISLPEIPPAIPFQVVSTGGQIDLGVVSQVTEIDLDTLYRWNPALNQWSTPPAGPHQLILPIEHGTLAAEQIAAVSPADRVQWLRIKVKSGDTLGQLAQRHKTDIASLRKANDLRGNQIRDGQSLLIPKSDSAFTNPVAKRSTGTTYIVQPGDSLWSISKTQKVSVNGLMKANHVGPQDYLKVGQRLTVPGGSSANGKTTGQASSQKTSRESVIRKVRYGVRKGDSLAVIAQKFNVTVGDIVSWNQLKLSDYLQPGQPLMLYVDVAAPVGD